MKPGWSGWSRPMTFGLVGALLVVIAIQTVLLHEQAAVRAVTRTPTEQE